MKTAQKTVVGLTKQQIFFKKTEWNEGIPMYLSFNIKLLFFFT